jgi:Tfp pilus assembly protein FimV
MRHWMNALCLTLFGLSTFCATGCDQTTTEPEPATTPAAEDHMDTESDIDIEVPGADIEIEKSEDETTE